MSSHLVPYITIDYTQQLTVAILKAYNRNRATSATMQMTRAIFPTLDVDIHIIPVPHEVPRMCAPE